MYETTWASAKTNRAFFTFFFTLLLRCRRSSCHLSSNVRECFRGFGTIDDRIRRLFRMLDLGARSLRFFKHSGLADDIWSRSMNSLSTCLTRLLRSANPDGSWGYRPNSPGCSEPTAFACIALASKNVEHRFCENGLNWLAQTQLENGAVPIVRGMTSPCWPTALATLAWLHAPGDLIGRLETNVSKACTWLLSTGGDRLDPMPDIYGHDTTLRGWSWAPSTHSWVEPTSYAVLALRAAGHSHHARVREGVAVLLDRAISTGGWNYGNPTILGTQLRPFPATTGIALAALAGEPLDERIITAMRYLQPTIQETSSPLSLAWGLMGLTAWGRRPPDADSRLECAVERGGRAGFGNLVDALVLLAESQRTLCPSSLVESTR